VKDGRICLDILSDFSSFFSDSANEGWSSAYSVQTILLQIQSAPFFFFYIYFQ
jgi:ubiquitin-protein ligase